MLGFPALVSVGQQYVLKGIHVLALKVQSHPCLANRHAWVYYETQVFR